MKLILIALLFLAGCQTTPKRSPVKPTEPTVLFYAKSSLSWPHEVAAAANCVYNQADFIAELRSIKKFDYTDDTGEEVYQKMKEITATIRTYKTKWPWSKAIATTYKSDRENVYFNRYRNPRPMEFMVNTSHHERYHLGGYGHGDNSKIGKEESVPYKLGALAQKYYLKHCKD